MRKYVRSRKVYKLGREERQRGIKWGKDKIFMRKKRHNVKGHERTLTFFFK